MNLSHVYRKSMPDWQMPRECIDVIFGRRELSPGVGLGVLARVGDSMDNREGAFVALEPRQQPRYVLFQLREHLMLVCSWQIPIAELGELIFQDRVYGLATDSLYHCEQFTASDGKRDLRLAVQFDWSGNWSANKNRNVVKLREKYPSPPGR